MTDVPALVDRLRRGDRLAAARLISLAESRSADARSAMRAIYPTTGRAHVIGVTGPPGSGKSTLVDKLIEHHRKAGRTVGVIAVDPSSPFTGGALLGDRIRMSSRQTDKGVFIRSMGSRGALGGLAPACADAVRILDALGKDVVLVETVGVGQGEIDVVRLADSVVVVAVPGLGDEVQNIKAGIMEIGDVFAVNKADREGADKTVAELQAWLEFRMSDDWIVPVVSTVAEKGHGVKELAEALARHREMLEKSGHLAQKRRSQAEHELLEILRAEVTRYVFDAHRARDAFRALVEEVAARRSDPYSAAESILGGFRELPPSFDPPA